MKIKVVPNFREEHETIVIDKLYPTSNTCIIGGTGSGKSMMLVNLLTRKQAGLCYYFNRVYILNPTIHTDPSYDIIKILQENYKVVKNRKKQKCEYIIIDDIQDARDFEQILDFIITDCKLDPEEKKLCILDDMLPFFTQNNSKLQELYISGRHNGLSTWTNTQSFTRLPRVCRINSLNIILFRVPKNELEVVAKDVADDEQTFLRKYKIATKNKYNFLVFRTREDEEHKFSHNFETYI